MMPFDDDDDDGVIWGGNQRGLRVVRDRIREFLDKELSLELKPEPYILGRLYASGSNGELALARPRVTLIISGRPKSTTKASHRVIRSASWNNNPRNCRPANRNRNTPVNRNNNLGFRVAAAQLPPVAIPLLPGDSAATVDLKAVFDRCYDAGPYAREIRYGEDTVIPPLRPDESNWVARVLEAQLG
jgi:hypothetical protein